jgi:hypothetical protein
MISILCPVCQKPLSDAECEGVFQCTRQKTHIEGIGDRDIIHATIFVNEDGKQTVKFIEVGAYAFEIHDQKDFKSTRITKIMPVGKGRIRRNGLTHARETLIVVPSVVNAPWHDPKLVEEKVRLYCWFL